MDGRMVGVGYLVERGLVPTRAAAYNLVARGVLPPGVVVRLGRRLLVAPGPLERWLADGGTVMVPSAAEGEVEP